MSFARNRLLTGQDYAIDFFLTARRKGRVAHAYCIAGPKAAGKRTFALEAARSLLCAGDAPDACDICRSCSRVERRIHFDLFWVEPPEGKRAIEIDQVRDLQKEMAFTPLEGSHKVAVICEADLMKEEAANSLLKVLEEPPPRSTLLLTTVDPTSLLPTITSRCQIIRLTRLGRSQAAQVLQGLAHISQDEGRLMAALSDGRLPLALSLIQEEARQRRRFALRVLSGKQEVDLMDCDNAVMERLGLPRRKRQEVRDALREVFEFGLYYCRDLLARRVGAGAEMLYNEDVLDELNAAAKRADLDALIEALDTFFSSSSLVDSYVNPNLVTEHLIQQLTASGVRMRKKQ